ncbi:MAG: hypothetical protein NTW50_04680 [Candidatus Berkelbacteria bacterium]|nr:hypothetical protein [Candidatus Berkelbacteria bacterium]
MVHGVKNSQDIMVWCVESALGLIFKGINSLGLDLNGGNLHGYLEQQTSDINVSRRDISKMVYELNRRKYIENVDGDSVVLTNKARIKIIDQISLTNGSDGKFRIVSFDIPEIKRGNRNCFRRAIKRMGFRQIQKSLWVSEYNVGNMVEIAAEEYGVSDFVAYFVADRSNIDIHIAEVLKKPKQAEEKSEKPPETKS